MNPTQVELCEFLRPHAEAAIGKQHPWIISHALAKAVQECGSKNNILIKAANNCLGIKAVEGVPSYTMQDSLADGRDDGVVKWRMFASLTDCFAEYAKMINKRAPYQPARDTFIIAFENIYADRTPGHSLSVRNKQGEVYRWMTEGK
jgi:DUF971 family protein